MVNCNYLGFILFLLCNQANNSFAQPVVDGPRNPTVFINDVSIGTVPWALTANVASSDNIRSTASTAVGILSIATSNLLLESGFGFSIPPTGVITGIQIDTERRQQGVILGSSVKDNSVKIIKGGVILGTEHASPAAWPNADSYVTYGNSTDLWGTTWSPADINAIEFGVAYASASLNTGLAALFLSAEIDHMRLTVYYTNTLPIELLDFSYSCIDNQVLLNWVTASQSNNDYFTIERSKDGVYFEQLDTIDGAGTISKLMNYSFIDSKPFEGITYYRLKQTDFNGSYKYGKIISGECDPTNSKAHLFPNPSSGKFNTAVIGNLIIYNLNGDEIHFQQTTTNSNQIDLSDHPNGIYYYQLKSNDEIIKTGKIIIE